MIICLPAQAQRRSGGMNADGDLLGGSSRGGGAGGYIPTDGWSLAVNGGYEMPQGDLKDSYKGAPTFGLTLSKRENHFIFSGTVDYRKFMPKEATTDLDPTQPGLATLTISDFTGIGLYISGAYEFLITPGSSFYIGVNGGYIYSSSSAEVDSPFGGQFISNKTRIPYLGPKLGLNFAINNTINVGVQARYSLSVTGATFSSRADPSYTPGFGSVAANLFLIYNF